MVALHHHLLGAPWRTVKRTIANRSTVLGALVDAGAELIVSGHVHQSAISERHEFEVVEGDVRGTTVVTAPGLGQPRPKRRGEARGLHFFEADETLADRGHVLLGRERLVPDRRAPLPAGPRWACLGFRGGGQRGRSRAMAGKALFGLATVAVAMAMALAACGGDEPTSFTPEVAGELRQFVRRLGDERNPPADESDAERICGCCTTSSRRG